MEHARGMVSLTIPGRVNIIGEHTDYNNCPVLPCAADKAISARCVPRSDNRVIVRDILRPGEGVDFILEQYVAPYPTGHWGNYVKAGVQGVLDSVFSWGLSIEGLHGFEVEFTSSIPPSAGMSSSSALVVMASVAVLVSNGVDVDGRTERLRLAEVCAVAERYTGTQGGGMDQAAILLGHAGNLMRIGFAPLDAQDVPLPLGYSLLVAHSTISAPKTQTVMDAFNRRSIECRLAAALLGSHLEKTYQVRGISFIGDLTESRTGLQQHVLEQVVQSTIHAYPYSLGEIADVLGLARSEVVTRWCHRRDGSAFPEPSESFKLHQRLMHVWSEWKRVEAMVGVLRTGDAVQAGALMDASHASCRDLHEISCPELDALTAACREAGALGSRLTGAGFGGCTISLVPTASLQSFMQQVGQAFYRNRMGFADWNQWMFPVTPSDGAKWYRDGL